MEDVPLIFGEVLFDCFEDGGAVLGGAPFNVAWHLQAFGCSPLFVSQVGNDALGRTIRDAMQHWGMTTAGLQLDSTHPTGKVQVSLKDGEPSFDILAQQAFDFISADALPPCRPSLIYHGSLGLRQPESAQALSEIRRQYPQAPVFMDVNLRPPWWEVEQITELLGAVRWVKLNNIELDILVNSPGDLKVKAAALLRRHGLALVIVTKGEQGAFAVEEGGGLFEVSPSKDVRVVDTVGAGDAFASVCILGLLHGWDINTVLGRAQAFASVVVEQQGATVERRDFYQPFKMQWELPNL